MICKNFSHSAYSLIEIIISLAILSLLCLISIPNYTTLISTIESHQCINQLQATLNFSKYLAQLNQQPIEIQFKPTQNLQLTDLMVYRLKTQNLILQDPSLFKLKYGYIQYNHPHLKLLPLIFYPAGHTNHPGTFSYHSKFPRQPLNKQLILSRTGQSRKTV